MAANDDCTPCYPRPPANPEFVWDYSGRMTDLKNGDYITTQSADTEYRKSNFYLHDKDGAVAAVYGVQFNYGDYKPRSPFPITITSFRDERASSGLDWPDDRLSIERLASFLAAHPALNKRDTHDFVVARKAAQMGGN